MEKLTKSIAIQTIVGLPLRLRILPSVKDIVQEKYVNSTDIEGFSKIWKYIRFVGRLSLSLFGKKWITISFSFIIYNYY